VVEELIMVNILHSPTIGINVCPDERRQNNRTSEKNTGKTKSQCYKILVTFF
jgi:hypothetical protein